MIRRTTINFNYAHKGKQAQLSSFLQESQKVVNLFIDNLWNKTNKKFVNSKVDTWLSARMQQCLGKQALEIIKSQHKKKRKTKPVFKAMSVNLDSRFVNFQFDNNSFDIWVKLLSLGNHMILKLPARKHKHFNGLIKKGFLLKNSLRLYKTAVGYSADLFFEKPEIIKKKQGKVVGVDIGYKKLLIDSNKNVYDVGLEKVYEKIARKKQKSKAFDRALVERNNLINQSLNKMELVSTRELVAEDLKGVKHKTKGRVRKEFNRKLQRWSYPRVLGKLSMLCEDAGITFTKVNPAYTSQTCCKCGAVDRKSRKGEVFKCIACENLIDADFNAAINISRMGVYSLHATKYY